MATVEYVRNNHSSFPEKSIIVTEPLVGGYSAEMLNHFYGADDNGIKVIYYDANVVKRLEVYKEQYNSVVFLKYKDKKIEPVAKDMEGVTSRILETSLDLPSTSISGFDIQGTLRLLNKGGNTVYDVVPELSSTNTFLTPRENFTVERIPPYGLVEIPFTIEKTSFFTHDYIPVSVTLDDTIYSKTVSVRPIAFLSLIGGIILVIAGGAFIFTKTTWRLPFQKQKR